MTNFINHKPYIERKASLPAKSTVNREKAIRDVVKIIRENKRIIEAATESSNENLHR